MPEHLAIYAPVGGFSTPQQQRYGDYYFTTVAPPESFPNANQAPSYTVSFRPSYQLGNGFVAHMGKRVYDDFEVDRFKRSGGDVYVWFRTWVGTQRFKYRVPVPCYQITWRKDLPENFVWVDRDFLDDKFKFVPLMLRQIPISPTPSPNLVFEANDPRECRLFWP